MNFQAYLAQFEQILRQQEPAAPYDNPDYFNYAKLNWSRMSRWLKKGVLTDEMIAAVQQITEPQNWIIITEPWCGDAAHILPFLEMIAQKNPLITVDYELRDSEPFRINEYLTRGGKAIPKLIIRDMEGNDLATWGPRPEACQVIYAKLMADKADFETVKTTLQHWYNENEGKAIQSELMVLLAPLR